jgi:hypothetical protein
LNIAHCKALAKSFDFVEKFINRIILDNCGIDDEEFAIILKGVKEIKDFKKIIYRRNIFNKNSLVEIKSLL